MESPVVKKVGQPSNCPEKCICPYCGYELERLVVRCGNCNNLNPKLKNLHECAVKKAEQLKLSSGLK